MPQMKISCFEDQLQLSTRWLEMAALGWSLCCCVHSILCHLLESIRFPAMLEVRGQLPAMRLGPGGGSDPVRQHRQISLVIMLTASRSTMCRLKWQLLDESMLRSTRCGARCSIVFGSLTVFPGHHVGWTEGLAGNGKERRGGSLNSQTISGLLVSHSRSPKRSTSLAQTETQVMLCLSNLPSARQCKTLDMMPHRCNKRSATAGTVLSARCR